MKREFQFEDVEGTKKSSYGEDFGKKNDYSANYGGSYKGESTYASREERSYQPRNDNYSDSYQPKSYSSSRPKGGWEDVKKAQES